MDIKEYHLTLKDHRAVLETILEHQVAARQKHREALAKLATQEAASDYTADYLNRRRAEADAELRAAHDAALAETQAAIDKLMGTVQEQYEAPIDLSEPQLATAINLVNVAGAQLEHHDLKRLVDTFTGSPPSLRALKAVFQARGLTTGVELVSNRLYEPALFGQRLNELARQAFQQNGSLNAIGYELRKLYQAEGLDFPRDGGNVDPQGVLDAVNRGAGLPVSG